MKRVIYAIIGIAVLGAVIAFNRSRTATTEVSSAPPAQVSTPRPPPESSPTPVKPDATRPAPARQSSREAAPIVPSGFNQALETLLSPRVTYAQKQAAWQQLRETDKLSDAITELEMRMANDPRSAVIPATLGQAYLQKSATLQDVREMGILGMKADQVFDTALSLDPSNWEARYTKAVALSYWPPQMNKGPEVIAQFQALIEQQQTLPPEPQYALPYAWLGDQYQKAGNTDYAKQVWQRGASLFPNDPGLKAKLGAGQ